MKGQIAGVQKANSCCGNVFTAVMKGGKALQSEVNKPDSKSSLLTSHDQWDYIKMLSVKYVSAIDEITFVLGRQVGADQFNLLRSKEETLNIGTLGTIYGLSDSENLRYNNW